MAVPISKIIIYKTGNKIMKLIRNYRLILVCMLALAMCLAFAACKDKEEADIDPHEQLMSMELEPDECAEVVPVLAYHKIKPYDPEDEATILEMYDTTFEEEMNYLKEAGFFTLTPDEFYQWYKGEIEVPKKSVLITFDDGFYGLYYYAYPIIKKNGQAATAFIIGHLIEETTPEWDPEAEVDHRIGEDVINETREEYPRWSCESHSFNMHKKINGKHPVDVFTKEEMVDDIKANEKYGFTYLAYPWGDYNTDMQDALRENGYKMAFAYDDPFYYATRDDDQYAVNRVRVNGTCTLDDFKKIVNCEDERHMPGYVPPEDDE